MEADTEKRTEEEEKRRAAQLRKGEKIEEEEVNTRPLSPNTTV